MGAPRSPAGGRPPAIEANLPPWLKPRKRHFSTPGTRDRPNRTTTPHLGHFCAEVPKSLHIAAYPRVLLIAAVCHAAAKPLQAAVFQYPLVSEMGLIAMQKVVGSNPISRFALNPLHLGHSALAGENQTTPAYDGDARGLAAIPPDSASRSASGGAKFASAKT